MKKVLFIAIISLIFVPIIAIPVLADKASPKLALAFIDDASDSTVGDEMNIILNNFAATSQKLLDKASPILAKLIDKSSPKLFGLDKSSPKLMKEWDSASPKLADYSKGWIDLAKNMEEGTYTADIAGTESTAAGQIKISSDSNKTAIISTLNLDGEIIQTITMTFDKGNGDCTISISGEKGGGIGGMLGYEWYLKFEGEK